MKFINFLIKDSLHEKHLRHNFLDNCPITYDNGKENVSHQHINASLGTQSFFCNPYHSWEKGSVEHIVGLVRRYLPKKTDFAKVSHHQIEYIEHQLNSRPRKCLNFRTPYEVFSLNRIALQG